MALLRPVVVTTDWHTVLDQWLSLIEVEADQQLDLRIVDAAAEVVETLHRRKRGLRGALRRFGNTLGELGWPLEHLNAWLAALSTLTSRSRRAELRSFESVAALTEGWAERYVRGAHAGVCFDAVTGLGTPTVLRMRLKEIYQHCRAFGITDRRLLLRGHRLRHRRPGPVRARRRDGHHRRRGRRRLPQGRDGDPPSRPGDRAGQQVRLDSRSCGTTGSGAARSADHQRR